VHGYRVRFPRVHAFNDVYLAVERPIGTEEPVRRPGAASPWHVDQIEDEKTMGVGVVADQSYCGPARSTVRPLIRCVDADDSGAVWGCDKAVLLSDRRGHVSSAR